MLPRIQNIVTRQCSAKSGDYIDNREDLQCTIATQYDATSQYNSTD